jgi:sec-independent protein translocase protein TatB
MSFSETIFLFFLALIIFGPKKLPEIARQAGRLLAELRRASNEFKSQIESEIANLEVQKSLEQRNNEVQKNEVQKSEAHSGEAPRSENLLLPAQAPEGTVASLSLNQAAEESAPKNAEPAATLAATEAETVNAPVPAVEPDTPSQVVVEASAPAPQASHV